MRSTPKEVATVLSEGNQESVDRARHAEGWLGCWQWALNGIGAILSRDLAASDAVVVYLKRAAYAAFAIGIGVWLPILAIQRGNVGVGCVMLTIIWTVPSVVSCRWAYLKVVRYLDTR